MPKIKRNTVTLLKSELVTLLGMALKGLQAEGKYKGMQIKSERPSVRAMRRNAETVLIQKLYNAHVKGGGR